MLINNWPRHLLPGWCSISGGGGRSSSLLSSESPVVHSQAHHTGPHPFHSQPITPGRECVGSVTQGACMNPSVWWPAAGLFAAAERAARTCPFQDTRLCHMAARRGCTQLKLRFEMCATLTSSAALHACLFYSPFSSKHALLSFREIWVSRAWSPTQCLSFSTLPVTWRCPDGFTRTCLRLASSSGLGTPVVSCFSAILRMTWATWRLTSLKAKSVCTSTSRRPRWTR